MSETTQEWIERLADEALQAGRDKPASWRVEYDSGSDGCMPAGWYVTGLDALQLPIVWPVRHEYGPLHSEAKARSFIQ